MKSTWSGRVQVAVKRVATAVAGAVSDPTAPRKTHVCDGFRCDCARRAEIASRSQAGAWLGRRPGWLERER